MAIQYGHSYTKESSVQPQRASPRSASTLASRSPAVTSAAGTASPTTTPTCDQNLRNGFRIAGPPLRLKKLPQSP